MNKYLDTLIKLIELPRTNQYQNVLVCKLASDANRPQYSAIENTYLETKLTLACHKAKHELDCHECIFSFKPDYQPHIIEVKNALKSHNNINTNTTIE